MNASNDSRNTPLVRDRVENFHGKQLLYVSWDHHTMICAPIAFLVSPDTAFEAVTRELIPSSAFALHPDFSSVAWDKVEWFASDKPFTPDLKKSLRELHLGHKSFLRLRTPGLNGIAGTGS